MTVILAVLIGTVAGLLLVIRDQGKVIRRQASMIVKLDAMCDLLSPLPKVSGIPTHNTMYGEPEDIAQRIAEEWK